MEKMTLRKIVLILCFLTMEKNIQAKECIFTSSTKCYSCDDVLSFEIASRELCEKLCPNRKDNAVGMGTHPAVVNCALKKCPNEAPLRDEKGNCYPCNTHWEYVFEANIQNCDICPNRYIDKNGNCLLKGQKELKPQWEKYKNGPYESDDTICPKDKPLKSWNNLCFSCNVKD